MFPSNIQDGGRRPSLISEIAITRPQIVRFAEILHNDRYEAALGQRTSGAIPRQKRPPPSANPVRFPVQANFAGLWVSYRSVPSGATLCIMILLARMLRAGIVFGDVWRSVRLSVCQHKI